tara:strand:- start:1646 stop:1762 length:117 start_codon:yes stop_codon:yes gene_type:complete
MKKVRKKIKIYDPVKNNTFVMMFGFSQPTTQKYKNKRR